MMQSVLSNFFLASLHDHVEQEASHHEDRADPLVAREWVPLHRGGVDHSEKLPSGANGGASQGAYFDDCVKDENLPEYGANRVQGQRLPQCWVAGDIAETFGESIREVARHNSLTVGQHAVSCA